MIVSVVIIIGLLFFLHVITLGLFSFINQKITKENFDYKYSVIYFIIGIPISLVFLFIVNIILELKFDKNVEFIVVFVSYLFPVILYNYGLRKNNSA